MSKAGATSHSLFLPLRDPLSLLEECVPYPTYPLEMVGGSECSTDYVPYYGLIARETEVAKALLIT